MSMVLGLGPVSKGIRSRFREISRGIVCALIFACAPQIEPIATECALNADQKTTLRGHWSVHPIPLAVQAVDFSASELVSVQAAINTWNTFFQESKGFSLFLSGTSSLDVLGAGGGHPTTRTICSQQMVNEHGFTQHLMIYKVTSGWSYGSAVIGLTSTCPVSTSSSLYPIYSAGMMEINFQNFFVAGQPVPDLQTIITHELGHLMGVDHSCSGSGCASAPEDYIQAVMYPSIGFDGIQGRAKRVLQPNDQKRANCLY